MLIDIILTSIFCITVAYAYVFIKKMTDQEY